MRSYDCKSHKKVEGIMDMLSETAELTIRYAFFVSFIGMGFGLMIGVACRGITSVVNTLFKIMK